MKKFIQNYIVCFSVLFVLSNCSDNPINQPGNNSVSNYNESPPIEPYYPIPSKAQLDWQNDEMGMFIHFGMNTFTDKEWGDGNEKPSSFNPGNIYVEQWIKIAKEIGFKYVILTAKHHDGFCLWPSKYTTHTIEYCPYKNGNGDIVKEFADACHQNGISFSFYLSEWDRNEKSYGTTQYDLFFRDQLTELLTNYGKVEVVWFDGAIDPNVTQQNYNSDLYWETIRHYQSDALISNIGPDVRWIGNENGLGGETEWCIQKRVSIFQFPDYENRVWYPSECDVSIRPGWFYHASEDHQLKSVEQLVDIYFKSVGRNSNLLLNVPPNKEGLISEYDIERLRKWKNRLDQIFANDLFQGQQIESSDTRDGSAAYSPKNCLDNNRNTFWGSNQNITSADLTITLPKEQKINIIRLEEAIEYGQRIKSFELYYEKNGLMEIFFEGTTIGRSRIVTFPVIEAKKLKIVIKDSFASPTLRIIKGFYSPYTGS